MAFNLPQNPLEQNALFAAAAEPAAAVPEKTPAPKKEKKQRSETPKASGTEEYVRATFIVRKDLLKMLKDYAYTERREIKDVINTLLERSLQQVLQDYEKQGDNLIDHR